MTTHRHLALFTFVFLVVCVATAQQPQPASPARSQFQIAGIVVDSLTMDPVPGATVLTAPVQNRGATRTARTGPDGRFVFSDLARGKYSLAGSARGYPTQGFEQHDAYATAIVAGTDLNSTHLVFRLQPGAAIRGRVIDEENEPVANATIHLFSTRTAEGRLATRLVRNASTNDLGSYSFAHLPQGTYYVAVTGQPWYASPGMRARRMYQQREQQAARERQQSEAIRDRLELPPPEEDDESVDRLDRVFPLTFYGGGNISEEASAIDLQPGQNLNADINVHAVPSIHVRIPSFEPPVTETSVPANDEGVFVSGRRMGRGASRRNGPTLNVQVFQTAFGDTLIPIGASSYEDGYGVALSGIAPGHYLLQISNPGRGGASGDAFQEADLTADGDLPSAATPAAKVGGTAEVKEGGPVPHALVIQFINRQIGRSAATRPKPTGEFSVEQSLMAGRYEVSVGNAESWYLSSLTATGAKISGRTLILAPGDNATLNLKISHGLAEINGAALRDSKPMSGAMIVLVPRNPGNSTVLFRRDQSDSDGTFTLRDVVPGKYTLIAIQDGWNLTWTDPTVLKRYLPKGELLQVAPSAKLQSTVTVQPR